MDPFVDSPDSLRYDEALRATLKELAEAKQHLARARERATLFWLDSTPVIDHLEKLQSSLSTDRQRLSTKTHTSSTLQSQLQSTNSRIRKQQTEEFEARMRIEELNRSLNQTRTQPERIGSEELARLKGEVRLKRQSLRASQLMERAVRVEIAALKESAAAACHRVEGLKGEKRMVVLSHEEYNAMIRRADEGEALAKWRVAASMEERREAEERRGKALMRLQQISSDGGGEIVEGEFVFQEWKI
ncbi:hypothetical protein QJS10_CPB12g01398 [Acorus calamus]|uniref:Uncharacterized protein n=1 Tax=Acorus calamus TaxID=4465 RepID=A0AAV9DPG7_ACOCL|nr:hypothetical protein QJS10_CPB12g01398 [Acorus calamus]